MSGRRRFGWLAALVGMAAAAAAAACGSDDARPAATPPTVGESEAGSGGTDAGARHEAGPTAADAEAPTCVGHGAPANECTCNVDLYENGSIMVTIPCGVGLCVESRNDERYCTPDGRLIAFRGCMNDGGAIPLCDGGADAGHD